MSRSDCSTGVSGLPHKDLPLHSEGVSGRLPAARQQGDCIHFGGKVTLHFMKQDDFF